MSVEPETAFLYIDGARLYYDVAGAGDPLLLIHGGLAHRRMWDDQLNAFAAHYRVIRPDLRGFGETQSPAGEFAYHADLRALLATLGVDQAHVLGLSFGGRVAIDFALAYPRMVKTLILVGSALGGYRFSDEAMARIDEADEALEAGEIDRGVELELRLWIDGPNRRSEEVNPDVRERVREMNAHNYRHVTQEGVPQLPTFTAAERLAEIAVPTLILVGDQDVPDMRAIADMLETEIPDTERKVIQGAAHHPNMERPEEFNRLVLDFLSRRGNG